MSLYEEGFDDLYRYFPDMKDAFPPFWKFLQWLVELDCRCKAEDGPPDCQIRKCATEKHIDVCPQCREYPCTLVIRLDARYPTIIQDGKNLQKAGIEE